MHCVNKSVITIARAWFRIVRLIWFLRPIGEAVVLWSTFEHSLLIIWITLVIILLNRLYLMVVRLSYWSFSLIFSILWWGLRFKCYLWPYFSWMSTEYTTKSVIFKCLTVFSWHDLRFFESIFAWCITYSLTEWIKFVFFLLFFLGLLTKFVLVL